jgi:hypothetical protein
MPVRLKSGRRWRKKWSALIMNLVFSATVLEKGGTTPRGLPGPWMRLPKVASPARQPWAGGRNPVGIDRTNRREMNIRSRSWASSWSGRNRDHTISRGSEFTKIGGCGFFWNANIARPAVAGRGRSGCRMRKSRGWRRTRSCPNSILFSNSRVCDRIDAVWH